MRLISFSYRPQTMIIYSQVFIFLHQIRRAKHLVDRMILIKLVTSIVPLLRTPEQYIKRYYSLRRKLNWIISTLLDFFESFVIEKEIKELNSVIKESTNIQELIEGHEIHVFRLRDRMLLNSTVSFSRDSSLSTPTDYFLLFRLNHFIKLLYQS